MKYDFKDTFQFKNKVDIKKITKELDKIKELSPENIIDFASNKEVELNKCFTWDNSIAASKWRFQEARYLMSSIIIIDEGIPSIRAYESIVVDEEENTARVYFKTIDAIKNIDLRKKVVENIKSLLQAASNKLEEFNDLCEYYNK
jgi:hypothetical protein